MGFASLPNRLGNLPEIYHAIPVERPPVYDTTAMITPLLHLADHFSPESRAKRQAAVAKANYEYRLYAGGGMDKLWWMKNQQQQMQMRLTASNIAKNEAYVKKLNERSGADKEAQQMANYFGTTLTTPSATSIVTPPPADGTTSFTEPDLPTSE